MSSPEFNRRAALGAIALSLAALPSVAAPVSDVDPKSLNAKKTTPLGLYLSPKAAHQALLDDPEILFVDVRDPIEIMFVGHPTGIDKIIPLRTATHQVTKKGQYKMVDNPDLVAEFEALLTATGKTKADPVFVICRSGGRSAKAANMLIKAGFTNVWNLVEGFEGDKNDKGIRALNGWRNAGLPWSYKLEPGVAWSK